MTPEQRLDRLERIAKLFVKAGLGARREGREQDKKIDHLISLQIHNEEKFANHDEQIADLIKLQKRNEERFVTLAESQTNTDRRLHELIDIIEEGRNGGSSSKS